MIGDPDHDTGHRGEEGKEEEYFGLCYICRSMQLHN